MSKEQRPRRTGGGLLVAILASFLALVALLAYSLERTAWLFTQFEQQQELAYAAAVVVELAAVALIAGSGAIGHLDQTARAWANRALIAVLSTQALANLSAGYLRGGRALLLLLDPEGGGAAYAVAAALWLVINLSVPALVLCLSKLLERLLATRAIAAQRTAEAAQLQPLLDAATADLAQAHSQTAQIQAQLAQLQAAAAQPDPLLAQYEEGVAQLQEELLRREGILAQERERAAQQARNHEAQLRSQEQELAQLREQAAQPIVFDGIDVLRVARRLRDGGASSRETADLLRMKESTLRDRLGKAAQNGHEVPV